MHRSTTRAMRIAPSLDVSSDAAARRCGRLPPRRHARCGHARQQQAAHAADATTGRGVHACLDRDPRRDDAGDGGGGGAASRAAATRASSRGPGWSTAALSQRAPSMRCWWSASPANASRSSGASRPRDDQPPSERPGFLRCRARPARVHEALVFSPSLPTSSSPSAVQSRSLSAHVLQEHRDRAMPGDLPRRRLRPPCRLPRMARGRPPTLIEYVRSELQAHGPPGSRSDGERVVAVVNKAANVPPSGPKSSGARQGRRQHALLMLVRRSRPPRRHTR